MTGVYQDVDRGTYCRAHQWQRSVPLLQLRDPPISAKNVVSGKYVGSWRVSYKYPGPPFETAVTVQEVDRIRQKARERA